MSEAVAAAAPPHRVYSLQDVVRPDSMGVTNDSWLGLLNITVVAGRNLRAMDITGKSDPFTVISFGPHTFRTPYISNTLNPIWNAECRLPVHKHSATYGLEFSVYDYDALTDNDFIGRYQTNIMELDIVNKLTFDNWIDVYYNDKAVKKSGGQIHLRIKFIPRAELDMQFWTGMANFFDSDHNGVICREEFAALLQCMNPDMDDDLVLSLFASADTNGDGTITPAELCAVMTSAPGPLFAKLQRCPVCHHLISGKCDAEVIGHLGLCFERTGPDAARTFVCGEFASEDLASRNLTGPGSLKRLQDVHESPEYVLVMDRVSGHVHEEYIPKSIRVALKSLYMTTAGKQAANTEKVKGVLRGMTENYGRKYTDPKSVAEIPKFIEQHHLNKDEILDPLDSFKNFNEFFYRKLKPSARPIAEPTNDSILVSPADCRCVVFDTISDATRIWIKGRHFSVASLLDNKDVAKRYEGGSLAIFRLAPQDYHRMHAPCTGQTVSSHPVGKEFFTVNPMAIRTPAFDVYTENKRCVTAFDTVAFGMLQYICVGATMVGSINLSFKDGDRLQKGDEWGYFAFGGSTVVVLFEPGRVRFDADLLANSARPLETLVAVGQQIGTAIRP